MQILSAASSSSRNDDDDGSEMTREEKIVKQSDFLIFIEGEKNNILSLDIDLSWMVFKIILFINAFNN